jgi:hypothetical protein
MLLNLLIGISSARAGIVSSRGIVAASGLLSGLRCAIGHLPILKLGLPENDVEGRHAGPGVTTFAITSCVDHPRD